MKMTFDAYYEELERLKKLDNLAVSSEYGVTAKDIETMKKDPEKFVSFCMYLITRPWYAGANGKNDDEKVFENVDALPLFEAAKALDDIINEAIELYDEE